jgi:hypothetical protein
MMMDQEVKAKFENFEKRLSLIEKRINSKKQIENLVQKKADLEHFYNEKQPVTYFEKIAVLGYFLEFITGKEEFSFDNIDSAWKQARESNIKEKDLKVVINNTLNRYKYLRNSRKGFYKMSKVGKEMVDRLPRETTKI